MKLKITDTILICFVSSSTFLLTLQYERGYLAFFGVDESIASTDYQRALLLVVSVGSLATLTLHFVNVAASLHPSPAPVGYKWRYFTWLFFALGAMYYVDQYFIPSRFEAYFLLVFFGFGAWGTATILWRPMRQLWAPLIMKARRFGRRPSPAVLDSNPVTSLVTPLRLQSYVKWGIIVLALFILIKITHHIGEVRASRCTTFAMLTDGSSRIVVARYSDRIVLSRFDPIFRTIGPDYWEVSVADLKDIAQHLEDLGPLYRAASKGPSTRPADEHSKFLK